ncbi:MAG: hypothetical protein ABSF95_04645 [Verrucomicrobiota bacterium]
MRLQTSGAKCRAAEQTKTHSTRRSSTIDSAQALGYAGAMATKLKVKGRIQVLYYREREAFIAYSPALDLSSCGSTFEEMEKNFDEAMNIFFSECAEKGTLEDVLTACGWESRNEDRCRVCRPPRIIGQKEIAVST